MIIFFLLLDFRCSAVAGLLLGLLLAGAIAGAADQALGGRVARHADDEEGPDRVQLGVHADARLMLSEMWKNWKGETK